MSAYVKYVVVGAFLFAIFDYFHPWSPTSYTKAAFQQIIGQADKRLSDEARKAAAPVLQTARETGKLDTTALEKAITPVADRARELEKIYRKATAPPPPPPGLGDLLALLPPSTAGNPYDYEARSKPELNSFVPASDQWYRFPVPLVLTTPLEVEALDQLLIVSRVLISAVDVQPVLAGRTSIRGLSDKPIEAGLPLSLYGRVRTRNGYSTPFPMARRTLLCPSQLGVGELEFTVQGANYNASTDGGYWLDVRHASHTDCPPLQQPLPASISSLPRPQPFVVADSLYWTPYAVDTSRPYRLRASGQVTIGLPGGFNLNMLQGQSRLRRLTASFHFLLLQICLPD